MSLIGANCCSVSLVSRIAGLSASSSSKVDTFDVKSAGYDSYHRQ